MISIRQKIPTTIPRNLNNIRTESPKLVKRLHRQDAIVVAAVRRGKGSALRWGVLLTTETQELGGVSTRRRKVSLR